MCKTVVEMSRGPTGRLSTNVAINRTTPKEEHAYVGKIRNI